MEKRTITLCGQDIVCEAKYNVGDQVILTKFHTGKTGKITRVIFPGDVMYTNPVEANGTMSIVYAIELDEPIPFGNPVYYYGKNYLLFDSEFSLA